jgi:uncharacterized membrane protein YfcA
VIVLAIPIGVVIGLSLGALGGGGSILTVPALVYLLDQAPHAATTASLLIVGISALAGMGAHWRAQRVRVGAGLAFGVIGVAGSYAGTKLSATVDPNLLLSAFAALMIVAAAAMFHRARQNHECGTGGGHQPVEPAPPSPGGGDSATTAAPTATGRRSRAARGVKVVVAATMVGLLTGFFGVGGGFVIVPALVLALGFSMPVAAGTSLLVIAINSAAALAVRAGSAHVHLNWALLLTFTVAAIGGSLAGGRIASRIDATKLSLSFVALLIAVALYTAARSIPPLV